MPHCLSSLEVALTAIGGYIGMSVLSGVILVAALRGIISNRNPKTTQTDRFGRVIVSSRRKLAESLDALHPLPSASLRGVISSSWPEISAYFGKVSYAFFIPQSYSEQATVLKAANEDIEEPPAAPTPCFSCCSCCRRKTRGTRAVSSHSDAASSTASPRMRGMSAHAEQSINNRGKSGAISVDLFRSSFSKEPSPSMDLTSERLLRGSGGGASDVFGLDEDQSLRIDLARPLTEQGTLNKISSQVEFLPRHVHRMYFLGSNAPSDPLILSRNVSAELAHAISEPEFAEQTGEINEIVKWKFIEKMLSNVLRIVAPALALVYERSRRQTKIKSLAEYFSEADFSFIRNARSRALGDSVRFGSDGESLAWLDILATDPDDNKAGAVGKPLLPAVIPLQGNGSFALPFKLDTSDPYATAHLALVSPDFHSLCRNLNELLREIRGRSAKSFCVRYSRPRRRMEELGADDINDLSNRKSLLEMPFLSERKPTRKTNKLGNRIYDIGWLAQKAVFSALQYVDSVNATLGARSDEARRAELAIEEYRQRVEKRMKTLDGSSRMDSALGPLSPLASPSTKAPLSGGRRNFLATIPGEEDHTAEDDARLQKARMWIPFGYPHAECTVHLGIMEGDRLCILLLPKSAPPPDETGVVPYYIPYGAQAFPTWREDLPDNWRSMRKWTLARKGRGHSASGSGKRLLKSGHGSSSSVGSMDMGALDRSSLAETAHHSAGTEEEANRFFNRGSDDEDSDGSEVQPFHRRSFGHAHIRMKRSRSAQAMEIIDYGSSFCLQFFRNIGSLFFTVLPQLRNSKSTTSWTLASVLFSLLVGVDAILSIVFIAGLFSLELKVAIALLLFPPLNFVVAPLLGFFSILSNSIVLQRTHAASLLASLVTAIAAFVAAALLTAEGPFGIYLGVVLPVSVLAVKYCLLICSRIRIAATESAENRPAPPSYLYAVPYVRRLLSDE
jgi:hypothetical protein